MERATGFGPPPSKRGFSRGATFRFPREPLPDFEEALVAKGILPLAGSPEVAVPHPLGGAEMERATGFGPATLSLEG